MLAFNNDNSSKLPIILDFPLCKTAEKKQHFLLGHTPGITQLSARSADILFGKIRE